MKNKKNYSNSYKNYLIGAGLVVGASSTILLGARLGYGESTKKTAAPIKELTGSNNMLYTPSVIAKSGATTSAGYVYLSDIPYMENISYTTKDRIRVDENINGELISLIVGGKQKYFTKGLVLHANATLAYDLREYDYDYLTVYLGLDASQGTNGNGVRFEVHTSEDGINWTLQDRINNNGVFKGNTEAYFLKYPVKNVKYLKFVVQDHGGNNTSDHAAFAGAMLINEGVEPTAGPTVNYIKTVAEYDALIKNFNTDNLSREQELILLQRTFVNNAGYDLLQGLANMNSDYNNAISWLMGDLDNLKLYVMGGAPSGTYYKSMTVLSDLYKNYHNDWNNTEISAYGNKKGDVYKKMAITLSLTHSANVNLWMQAGGSNNSNAVTRYAIYKQMYDENKFTGANRANITPWFESYSVEEMRFVMNTALDDEEILWLHDYTQYRIELGTGTLAPHKYIAYIWPNYGNNVYYDEANYEYFNELFAVPQKDADGNYLTDANGNIIKKYMWPVKDNPDALTYNITRGTTTNKIYKVWMNLRNKFNTGAVCGGISKTGVNIKAVHGVPATVVGQPGHAAIAYYWRDSQGRGYWALDNNVSGWTLSTKGDRLLLGWGNDARYRSGNNIPYLGMSQEALNRFDAYQKSTEMRLLAEVYNDNATKKEEYLWKSLDELDFNLDTWYSLIELYLNDSTKTEEDYFELADKMGEKLMKYPLAFYDLMKLIKPKMTSVAYQFKYSLLLTDILNKGKVYTGTDIANPALTRTEASYLLGLTDPSLATFSFDGDNAGKIVLSRRFDGTGVRWDYSLTGKEGPWIETDFSAEEEHKLQLTPEQLASITAENDIYIHIVGVDYSDKNLFKIDILESAGMPATLYANDLENKMIGTNATLEWKLNESDGWTLFTDRLPDLTGDKDLMVRVKATGVRLGSPTYTTYHFTTDTDTPERKYIPISHLSLESVSSQATSQGRYATNVIDGNAYTNWHSDWNGGDTTKEIVIKLDEPKNLTAFEYLPLGGGNGKILSARILISMDGENWTEVVSGTNWTYRNTSDISIKTVDFEPTKGQYIKIIGDKTQTASAGKSYMTGSMFNFYENTTVKIVGTFSFDGDKAGKIVLDEEEYNGGSWQYSLNSGDSWNIVTGETHELTAAEIASINETDMIKIKLDGDSKVYSITIKKAEMPVAAGSLNDLENRLISVPNIDKIEWKIKDSNDNWKAYSEEEPIVTGNNTLLVRTKASGILQASDPREYVFTEDSTDPSRIYIPVKHLTVHDYSTQSVDSGRPYYAPNAIDGNINTLWHTDFRYSVLTQEVKPFITIQLDTPRYVSALEFIQVQYKVNDPVFVRNARVYVSMDGENWTEAGRIEDCPQNIATREINFTESVYGQYVKLEFDTYGIFAAVAELSLYEDTNKKLPSVDLEYDITTKTQGPVTVTLKSDKDITILNNEGSHTYTFTENGSFVFEYTDSQGHEQIITATVDWIDNEAPIGTVSYSTRDVTNQDVVVTLETNEPVTITNNDGLNTYTFTENGEFTFEFVDEAGNAGSTTVAVDWINKNAPVGEITYSINSKTNQDVVATLDIGPGIIVANNNGSKTYTFTENGEFTFELMDNAGNRGTATAAVTWIDKSAPVGTITYNINTLTNSSVEAKLSANENIIILNNNGSGTYIFTENGSFIFEYLDEAGNRSTSTATVTWIDKNVPIGTVTYSTEELTNQDVIATLSTDKEVTITNNGGRNTYTFTENGTFTFEFVDKAGNRGSSTVTVNWIDKVAPKGTLTYSKTEPTNEDVIVTLTVDKEVLILNNNGSNTYTFTRNGEMTFTFVDKAGNEGRVTAKVDWIEKEAPKAILEYSITTITNSDVTVTLKTDREITITNNDGKNTYTFTENGEFTFEYVDRVGNKGEATAKVYWIDKNAPIGTVTYSTNELTNKDVVATLTVGEGVTIISEGGNTHVFTENGEFTFEFVDESGNHGTAIAKVNWIDKVAPIGNLSYNKTCLTNEDVDVTLIVDKEVTITNNNGSNIYTFTENGEFTFEFIDKAGNTGSITARVDWIDKKTPIGFLDYDITTITKENVTVTLKSDKEITILNNDGKDTYTFTKNGEFTFEFVDKAGNKGTATAKVYWIDKEEEKTVALLYDTETLTNEDVTVTIVSAKPIFITNNGGKETYTFTENGEFTFWYIDEDGVVESITANVNWIDKKAPEAEIKYSTKEQTTQNVVVTLEFDKENVTIINNGGKPSYTFTENGEFTFEFIDKAGNKGSIVAKVDWIKTAENPSTPTTPPTNPESPKEPANPIVPSNPVENNGNVDNNYSNNNVIVANSTPQDQDKKDEDKENNNGTDDNTDVKDNKNDKKPSSEEETKEEDKEEKSYIKYVITGVIASITAVLSIFTIKMKKNKNKDNKEQ